MKTLDFTPLFNAMRGDATFKAMSLEERQELYLEATTCVAEEAYAIGDEALHLKAQVLHLRESTRGLVRNAMFDDAQAAAAQRSIAQLANAELALDRCKRSIARVQGQLDYLAELANVLHL